MLNELYLLWINACMHTSDMHARDVRAGRVAGECACIDRQRPAEWHL